MFLVYDFSWLLLYIAGFGFSDLLVENFIKQKKYQIVYYTIILIASVSMIVYSLLVSNK